MLLSLSIRNYAIIDELSIRPDAQLTTLTGETGAGKSIILGALSLILGERADSSVLINKDEKCVVEACFDVAANAGFRAALTAEDLDDDAQCIIRREVAPTGKSRAFINDTPVNLAVLNRLSSLLVDLHQQFDHLALKEDSFQLDVLDAIAGNSEIRQQYSLAFKAWHATHTTLQMLQAEHQRRQQEADYKLFLFNELANAGFHENEVEEVENQLKTLSHAEKILGVLQATRAVLTESEQPLTGELRKSIQQLTGITEWLPSVAPLHERLNSAWLELKDISDELSRLEESIDLDASLVQRLQERLDLGYRLFKKHSLSSTAELLQLQNNLADDLKASSDLSEKLEKLRQQLADQQETLHRNATVLSGKRATVAPQLAAEITRLLALVGMPNARFEIRLSPSTQPSIIGADEVEFLLDANKSGRLQALHRAASGGEMNRIMLAIKSLTAQAMQLPTLIFDEVDTGISGEAARQVGLLLRRLADYHQVICITHQPQVAARGTQHFFVFKEADQEGRIHTRVRSLSDEERVMAIARMIGGEKPSDAAVNHAKELVQQ